MNADQAQLFNPSEMPANSTATAVLVTKLREDLSPELLNLVAGGDDIVCWYQQRGGPSVNHASAL